MNDKDRFMKLQQDVLGATKTAIQQNAPGLPVANLAAYVRQVGGDILCVDERMDIKKFPDKNPFRLCVTTRTRPDFEKAVHVEVVARVIGWG